MEPKYSLVRSKRDFPSENTIRETNEVLLDKQMQQV